MESILTTVLPVFGMIVLGYCFTRAKIFDAAAGRGLSLFVFNLAIPALLFKTVATMGAQQGAPWELWIAFFGGLFITWVTAALVSRIVPSLNVSGGAAASMAAGFGNLALLGTPLALSHFGQQVAMPLGMILSIHAPILWFTAMLHRALFQTTGSVSITGTAKDLFRNLASNAIVLPQQAVTRSAQGDTVMVVGADGKAKPRPVKVGGQQRGQWVILDGLQSGEQVMVDGFQKLRGDAPVKPVPWVAPGSQPSAPASAATAAAAPASAAPPAPAASAASR